MNWGRASCLSGPRDKWKQPLEWKVDKCENPNVFSDDEQVSIKYSLWSIQDIEKVAINQHWSLWTSIWERATRSVSSKVFSMVISPSNDADTHLTLPHTSPESNPMFLQCQTHKLFSNVHLSVAFLLEDWNCPMHLSEIWCSPTFLPFFPLPCFLHPSSCFVCWLSSDSHRNPSVLTMSAIFLFAG